ncbi:MAG: hypothetical protein FXF47_09080 [Candidatus Mcinerneyibacterium aminivorans]|uniref:Uncharacterized protein n=1 Tax=Candidatus Mcinerneyibacterium aminivorans TaxID=2703815 RepID=A0A5D0MBR8_9BACT|nr:MAG: hypothetical protein FXF47_09080 [Candidatus Mcinerneyibacterium aminivorans]
MLKNMDIYWIGGSPCSVKSSFAEMIKDEFDFHYYKIDDHLERFMKEGAEKNISILKMFYEMNLDQTWLRDVDIQIEDEFEFYNKTFQFIKKEIKHINTKKPVITEGAALLPTLMDDYDISDNRYVCITSTAEFQLKHFKKRKWISHYLKGCTAPKKAYDNWMKRDIGFAKRVKNMAKKLDKNYFEMNDEIDKNKMYEKIISIFGLKGN